MDLDFSDFSVKIKNLWNVAYRHPFKEKVFNTAKIPAAFSTNMSQSLPGDVYRNELSCFLHAFCIEIAYKMYLICFPWKMPQMNSFLIEFWASIYTDHM